MRAVIVAAALLAAAPAVAHDLDCRSKPIDQAVKSACCGQADAHQIEFDKIYEDDNGFWHVVLDDGDRKVVDAEGQPIQPLPSSDGCDWAWYRRNDPSTGQWPADGSGTGPLVHFYCIQIVLGL